MLRQLRGGSGKGPRHPKSLSPGECSTRCRVSGATLAGANNFGVPLCVRCDLIRCARAMPYISAPRSLPAALNLIRSFQAWGQAAQGRRRARRVRRRDSIHRELRGSGKYRSPASLGLPAIGPITVSIASAGPRHRLTVWPDTRSGSLFRKFFETSTTLMVATLLFSITLLRLMPRSRRMTTALSPWGRHWQPPPDSSPTTVRS